MLAKAPTIQFNVQIPLVAGFSVLPTLSPDFLLSRDVHYVFMESAYLGHFITIMSARFPSQCLGRYTFEEVEE
jgi:hypothetical protein